MEILIVSNANLTILHLSDCQFGAYNRFTKEFDPEEFGVWVANNLKENCLGKDERPQLIIVSGDITEMGLKREFEQAQAFFKQLSFHLGLHTSECVFVPGNHDVHWGRSKRITEDNATGDREFNSEEEFIEQRNDEKLAFYHQFIASLNAEGKELSHGARIYDFPQQLISVAALNSCEIETHDVHLGHVSESQLQTVLDSWKESVYDSRLKLIVVHHNPIASVPDQRNNWIEWMKTQIAAGSGITDELIQRYADDVSGFDAKNALIRFADESAAPLVFFGHQHADDIQSIKRGQSRICFLSAGSSALIANKLPGEHPNSLNLIRLNRGTGELRVQTISYSSRVYTMGQIRAGAFRPDPDRDDFFEEINVPQAFRAIDKRSASAPDQLYPFIQSFRDKLYAKFERLDSRFTYVPAVNADNGRPNNPELDQIYIPLRFADGHNRSKTDRGEAIGAAELLSLEKPLAITGFPGSGKTTWVKWIFRKLLDPAHDVLPIPVILRDVLLYWDEQEDHTLKAYLEHWIVQNLGKEWCGVLTEWIDRHLLGGPRLVLLIDGWDELGEAGTDFRQQLVAWSQGLDPKCFQLAVTSRPYGTERPSEHDAGFSV